MSFIRTKKINEKVYAYLVENKWTPKGSRQTSKKYLGRVFSLSKVSDDLHLTTFSPSQKTREGLLRTILCAALVGYGFTIQKLKATTKELVVDLVTFSVIQKTGKRAALAINDGILSTETLSRILNYEKSEDIGKEGYLLAKYCVEAGLVVPEKHFVALYEANTEKEKPFNGA